MPPRPDRRRRRNLIWVGLVLLAVALWIAGLVIYTYVHGPGRFG